MAVTYDENVMLTFAEQFHGRGPGPHPAQAPSTVRRRGQGSPQAASAASLPSTESRTASGRRAEGIYVTGGDRSPPAVASAISGSSETGGDHPPRSMLACVLAIVGGMSLDVRLLVPMFASACRAAASDTLFSGKLGIGSSQGRADLDGDGVDDCWTATVSSGSGGDSVSLAVEAPCGSKAFAIDTVASFDDFLARTPLPSVLASRPRLVQGIADIMYGHDHIRKMIAIDDSFRLLLGETPRWSAGAPRLPPSQVIIQHNPDEMIAYFAHNHGSLRTMAHCAGIDVLVTYHGIVLYDPRRDQSSWVYVANGLGKLRRPSIAGVSCGEQGTLLIHERDQTVTITIPVKRSSSP